MLFIGKEAYLQADYDNAILWFKSGLNCSRSDGTSCTLKPETHNDLLDYLAFSYYQNDNIDDALNVTLALLDLDKTNSRIANNVVYYQNLIQDRAALAANTTSAATSTPPQLNPVVKDKTAANDNLLRRTPAEMSAFRAICRGVHFANLTQPGYCTTVQVDGLPQVLDLNAMRCLF
jgi:hypothetical protein